MWPNFDGKPYTREQLKAHIDSLDFSNWRRKDGTRGRPLYIVFHNTSEPTIEQWMGWSAQKRQDYIHNVQQYYEDDLGWKAGPHYFVPPTVDPCCFGFSNPVTAGTHCSCFNSDSIGIEHVGEFNVEAYDSGPGAIVRDNGIYLMALLHNKLGLEPAPYSYGVRGLHFHIECAHDNHDCPGKNVHKPDVVARIQAEMVRLKSPSPAPPEVVIAGHPDIKKGSTGPAVVELQTKLGVLIPDGDFGSITDTWVRAFQASCGLGADGLVGQKTWTAVDALQVRVNAGPLPLPKALVDRIYTMAQQSEIADYSWPDRGVPPQGYIPGIALAFAYALQRAGDDAVEVMCRAAGDPDTDALAWYKPEFQALGMSNNRHGWDTMRHLFVMMMGLGPRESSGKYCEGRDLSASNVESDTAEAGLFQTSWNIRSASAAIPPLLPQFWANPNGFLKEFKINISPTSDNLNSYGSGDGVKYQWLSRFCPLFHVMVTGVGMRTLRQHWGPINRREVTLKREADHLLKDVQNLVASVA